MCIALYLKKYVTVDRDTLINCYTSNPDGFGFAYYDENNKLVIRKFIGEQNILLGIEEFLLTRTHYINKQMLAHFRIASHGKISKKTCHPFKINDDIVFCHNGILSDFSQKLSLDSKLSDTMLFNKKVFHKLPRDFMSHPVYKKMLEETIGSWNKMILLNANGTHWILNEDQGEWHNGIWYSNSTYKSYESYYTSDICSNSIVEHTPLYKRAYKYCKKAITILPEVVAYFKILMEE